MEKITELLDKLENLGELIPKLDTLTGWVQWLVSLAVRVGPVCMLVLGLILVRHWKKFYPSAVPAQSAVNNK